jgi:acyl-coenzyme A synthetase/AMP-(fatty) acid ligase
MITGRIHQWALLQPASPALIWNDVSLSYAAFWRLIDASRRFLERQEMPAGRIAIVLIDSYLDAWVVIMGLRGLGLHTICVDSIAEAELLGLRDVACLVVSQAEQGAHGLVGNPVSGTRVITVPAEAFAVFQSGALPIDRPCTCPFGGHILYTSGTTGSKKKVMMSGASEDRRNDARARSWGFGRHTVHHGMDFPLWTGAGFKQASAVWHAGGCLVLDQRPGNVGRLFRHGITNAALTPPMLKELLRVTTAAGPSRREFELAIGAGFLSIALAQEVARRLTRTVDIPYGCTELGTYALSSRFRTKDDLLWLTPAEGCTVQIVDADGVECPIGREGALRILTTDVDCASYFDDEEASAQVFRGGYFYPGDMAVRRADGRIRILGRTADVLNLHGSKIPVVPVEQSIQQQLRVDDVCLFSGLNDDGNEELVIAIESDRDLAVTDLETVNRRFASFDRVRFVLLKEFPRAGTGMRKVQRAVLRKFVFPEPGGSDSLGSSG